jgi:selenocysteine lyase/cysteine desulfurase
LVVKLLNDRYGIQTRGGCSCAGTYGHYLLNVDLLTSKAIEQKILKGCLIERPGWVRMSVHPIMTDMEIDFICEAIKQVSLHHNEWGKDYEYDNLKNEFIYKDEEPVERKITAEWFNIK